MDTPHNDKQRKSLFSHKLAQTLVGLIAVCFLIFCIRSPSTSSPSPFQTTSPEKETALKWIFITPYGETDSSYADLFLSQEDCTELAGTPVELSFCTIEKYLNMTASGISADVVTCWYTDSNFKRLETTGTTWALQDLLDKEIPGFTLPENFIRWCGNFQGDVYAYPHTGTILSEDTSIKSAAAMIGRKDILEKIHWDSQQPLSKAYCLEQLKAVRKAYPELIPCYVELPSLQQMFGVTADTGTAWERSGLGDLLKNAKPMKSIGIDSQYTVPIIHYEILFSLYSNTRLATADERKQKFLENQIVNLVEDCSADEIAPTYARLVSELQRGDYKLLDTWKKQQYQKAISILQE